VFIEAHSQSWAHCDEDCLHDLSNFLEYISATVRYRLHSMILSTHECIEMYVYVDMAYRDLKQYIITPWLYLDKPPKSLENLVKYYRVNCIDILFTA